MAAALWGPLNVLEVAVRNAIHDAMSSQYGHQWWDSANVYLANREVEGFKSAKEKLTRTGNVSPTPDDVVGASSFGLWTGLLDVGAARNPYMDYETKLWPVLQDAFPNREVLGRRHLHTRLDILRKLRNRVAHHEPLLRINHKDQIERIANFISFIDEDMADFVDATQRVDDVISRKRAAMERGEASL